MRPFPLLPLLLAAALAACGRLGLDDENRTAIRTAAPADAAEAALPGDPGRLAVRAAGGPDDTLAEVDAELLRQAARLTLDAGNDWFRVVSRDAGSTTRFPSARAGSAGRSGPVFYGGGYRDLDLAPGVSESATQYEVRAVIEVRDGPAPLDDPSAYDARAILRAEGTAAE